MRCVQRDTYVDPFILTNLREIIFLEFFFNFCVETQAPAPKYYDLNPPMNSIQHGGEGGFRCLQPLNKNPQYLGCSTNENVYGTIQHKPSTNR